MHNIDFDYVKTRLKGIALSTFHGYSSNSLPLNVSRAELLALKKLSRNKDLVIVRPDKGNGIVFPCSSKSFLNFRLSSTRLLITWFLIKERVVLKVS